jgi:hypothetical protein
MYDRRKILGACERLDWLRGGAKPPLSQAFRA